jgi:hypothetical protein
VRAFSEIQKDHNGSFCIVNDRDHFAGWVESYFRERGNELRKVQSEAAEPLWIVNAIARLGDLPLSPIATAQLTSEIDSSVPFSASCTAINDEIRTTSTW